MSDSKLLSLSRAIARFVPDSSQVVMGTSLETFIPFAAGHELIRQRKRDLTLIGPISDILFDQVVGGGCVHKIRAAWVGNVITGSGYNFRRAVEGGTIEMEDHSNLTVSMALRAGAMGVPFMPARTALGSDLFKTNTSLKVISCPFTGDTLAAVAAINPDVAIIHVQRADEYGNAHAWGNLGITREACMASRHVIITAEEIVSPDVITSDPNRVITPGFRVSAVVHAPWGAHPSPVPGYYNRDHQGFIDYRTASKTSETFADWQARWVDAVHSSDDYLRLLGEERVAELALNHHVIPEAVDYGY
ncbi:CoA transferase subunit A [Desulfonema magnum]|uniref:Coenzyme A transferase n=1 Tax=Desulfonema magnum TaxID=45655 RepID=A0A975GS05_9BACT|nr:CoA-transferase [Desulfonema magnum]QTA91556.1 Coenzyme A transferase [Desulfonema magnum]